VGDAAEPRWRAWMAPAALLAGLAGALVGGGVVYLIAAAFGASTDNPPASVNLVGTFVQDACLVVAAISFARLARRPSPAQFGLRLPRLKTAAGAVAVAWVAFFAFTAVWVAAVNVHQKDNLPDKLGANSSSIALAAVAVLVCVVAPIAEEFFFRGFFFPALKGAAGRWGAAVLTGLVFGAIHGGSAPVGYLVPLAFFGFVLCLLYERTGSLLPCMALHSLNNSLALGSSEHWSWQVPLLMGGALAVVATVIVPVARRSAPRPRLA
jgi:membrane protease YdiL (CAAX protease family)